MIRLVACAILSIACSAKTLAQEFLSVESISVNGNDRTKLSYIQKLLPFSVGDSIGKQHLSSTLKEGQTNLTNSKLFNSVTTETAFPDSGKVRILIYVEERWYLYPVPYASIADRNFNEWWVDRNRSLQRLVFGGDIVQKNLSGHNDDLKMSVLVGFEQKIRAKYSIPFLSKSKKWGFTSGMEWVENKTVAVTTADNKLQFWQSDGRLRQKLDIYTGITFQPKFLKIHELNLAYGNFQIHDSLASHHPDYLLNDESHLHFFRLSYSFLLDKRDYRGYPTSGYLIGATIQETVFSKNNHITSGLFRLNKHLSTGRLTFSSQSVVYTSWPQNQPYALQNGFGWGNNLVRGYNYYVIEGENYFIQKLSLSRKTSTISIKTPFLPSQAKELNTTLYPKIFLDVGYVSSAQFNENGELDNRLLIGFGAGVDLLSYYDSVWRLEYAVNNQWESGFFLNFTLFIQ